MPTINEYLESTVVMGDCNCDNCRKSRKHAAYLDFLESFYPGMVVLPKSLDLYSMDASEVWWHDSLQMCTEKDQWRYAQGLITELRTYNNRSLGQHRLHGTEVDFCEYCGKVHKKEQIKTITNVSGTELAMCKSCRNKYFATCPDCNGFCWKSDLNYYPACPVCLNENYNNCSHCGGTHRNESLRIWDEALHGWADQMTYGLSTENGLLEDHPQMCICEHCQGGPRYSCEVCERSYYGWQIYSDYDGYDYICKRCSESNRVIQNWEWKPVPQYNTAPNNPKRTPGKLFYGVEVEVERDYDIQGLSRVKFAKEAIEHMGADFVYIKADASLDNGVEIVTHPFTWQLYRDQRNMWNEFFQMARDSGYHADDTYTTGFHVHMSKDAFTSLHLYKFLHFLYSRENRQFIYAISGRQHGEYCQYSDEDTECCKYTAKRKYNASEERHSAVNLTNHTTVEMRMFKGTLKPDLFHKNMEFCQSLFEFASKASLKSVSVPRYWSYIKSKKNLGRFRNLVGFIKQRETVRGQYSLT